MIRDTFFFWGGDFLFSILCSVPEYKHGPCNIRMSLKVPMEDIGKEKSAWGDCGLDKEALDLD